MTREEIIKGLTAIRNTYADRGYVRRVVEAALAALSEEPLAEGVGYVAEVGVKLLPQYVSLVKGGCYTKRARFLVLPPRRSQRILSRNGVIVEPDTCKQVPCFCADEPEEEPHG